MKRWAKSGLFAFLGLAALLAGCWVWFTTPGRSYAASLCPACFGFRQRDAQTYIEASVTTFSPIIDEARQRVTLWYGPPETQPRFFICMNIACARRIDPGYGGALGLTSAQGLIVLLPGGNSPVIAAHEWSHAELKRPLGLSNFVRAKVPPWFDEGLAVVVAQDERYLAPEVAQKYCPPDFAANDLDRWQPNADSRMGYAAAACVVKHWLQTHDGAAGPQRLIAAIRQGESFTQAFQGG